jgi:ferredoxin-NADP reductase
LPPPDAVGLASKTCYRTGMGERDPAGKGAPETLGAGASGAELDRLLATIRRRRLMHAERTRAAGGSVPLARPAVTPGDTVPLRSAVAGMPPARVALRDPTTARPAPAPPAAARAPAPSTAGGVLLEAVDVGPAVRILRVARPQGFSFRAGQAVKLGLPGVATRRTYSIASAPQDAHLEFCIELVPGGRLSSLLFRLAAGARLELAPKPKGSFVLQSGKRVHLMVATVTGIAPLRSMLRAALAEVTRSTDEFWVLHGASHADELPYAAELAELERRDPRVRYLPTVSRPGASRNQGWAGLTGRVEAHLLATAQSLAARANATRADIAVYACGHPEMVLNVQDTLRPLGYAVSAEDFG